MSGRSPPSSTERAKAQGGAEGDPRPGDRVELTHHGVHAANSALLSVADSSKPLGLNVQDFAVRCCGLQHRAESLL